MNIVVTNGSFMKPTLKLLVCQNMTPDPIYIYVSDCDTQFNICVET